MKSYAAPILFAVSFALFCQTGHAGECKTGVVTDLAVEGDADWGNQIAFYLNTNADRRYYIDDTHDINDSPGHGLLQLLALSSLSETQVTTYDLYGRCDGIIGVWLK